LTETPYHSGERRPIAARNWRISQQVAHWLARRGASPNGISLVGMLCGIAAGLALAATSFVSDWPQRLAWLAAAALIQCRLLANMWDGMVAIESGRTSPVGELYNDVPDRISDAAGLIGAGYAFGGCVELGYVAACVALGTAYVRALGKAAGTSQEFCGPMAKQQRMAVLTVVALYCGLTPHAWQPHWRDTPWGLTAAALLVIIAGGLLTILRRLKRIADNLRKRPS
jgi:phosphatidylglycerophosphate synthase